jgi:hypothetical protein
MTTAHDLPPQTNTDIHIPTQTSPTKPILDLIHSSDDSAIEHEPITSEEDLRKLKAKLDKKQLLDGPTVVLAFLDEITEPKKEDTETDADFRARIIIAAQERSEAQKQVKEADQFYQAQFFQPGVTTSMRLDRDLLEKLYDDTSQAHNALLDSITNAQNSGIFGEKYLRPLVEADRIARLMYLNSQGSADIQAKDEPA